MRQREQVVEAVVRQLQHLQGLVLVEALAPPLEHLLACHRQNVAHPYVSSWLEHVGGTDN